jgi:hypothetical protein
LPTGSVAAAATQARDSYECSAASAASSTGATAAEAGPDKAGANAGADNTGSHGRTSSANSAGHGGASSSAAGAAGAGMSAAGAAAAGMAAAAATAFRCNSYVLAKWGVFSIEDLKGRQTDVGDFLLTENKSACIVMRRCSCGCGCRRTARHGQRNPGCPQCQGSLSSFPYGTSLRLCHGRASLSVFEEWTHSCTL